MPTDPRSWMIALLHFQLRYKSIHVDVTVFVKLDSKLVHQFVVKVSRDIAKSVRQGQLTGKLQKPLFYITAYILNDYFEMQFATHFQNCHNS